MDSIFDKLRAFHPLHALRKTRLFRGLLPWMDWPVPMAVGLPKRICGRMVSHASLYLSPRTIEPEIFRLFELVVAELEPDSVIYDLGGNVGLFTWHALTVRNDVRIVCVEPDPRNVALLRTTQRWWASDRVQIVAMAASDHSGTGTFYLDAVTSATGSLSPEGFVERHFKARRPEIEVGLVTLDDLCERHGRPSLVKIDVEGHELAVLRGGEAVLRNSAPVLFYESFEDKNGMAALLTGMGYILVDSDKLCFPTDESTNFAAFSKNCRVLAKVRGVVRGI